MSEMTIAQALRHAKKLKGRIDEARARAVASVNYLKASTPPFRFDEQMARANKAGSELAELQGLLAVANATNTVTHDGHEVTLAHAVRLLQELKGRLAWLRGMSVKPAAVTGEQSLIYAAGGHQTIIQEVACDLPEATKADLVDKIQDQFDALNGAVEALNQTVRI